MANNINIAVNVSDNGTTAQATVAARGLTQALQNAATAAAGIRVPTATAAARQGVAAQQSLPARAAAAGPAGTASDTNLSRGIGGQTGASGRDFAAQAQGLGGLVHVYATFAANLYAVSAAFGALSKAADTANIIKGLDQLGAASGRSLGTLAKSMVSATDGAISLRQAMTSTALATAGGMSSKAILEMTDVAKKASLALGRDMSDSMDRLTKGIVKIQPELLDELGIMARVIPSQQAYAREMGKSVDSLTDFEKRQAFMNAVLKEGAAKYKDIAIAANPYSKLTASLADLSQSALNGINTVLGPLMLFLSESPTGLTMAVGTLAGLLLKQAIPALGQYRKSLEDLRQLNLEKAANKSDILTDTGQYDAAQADRSKQAYLDRNKYATQSAEVQARLLKESEDIHAGVLARNEARSKSFLGHETTNQMIINRAYSDAAASNIKSDVAQTQSRYGLVAAWRRLNEEINVSKTTGQLLKFGDGIEAMAPKTNALQNGFMRLAGGIMILGSAIGTIIEAFAPWLLLIGVITAGIGFLMDHFSKAKEESAKASKAFDSVNNAFTTIGNTLDAINRKPFLEQLNQASIQAKANAVNELVDTVDALAKATAEANKKMGFWDTLSDWRMGHDFIKLITLDFKFTSADKFYSSQQLTEGLEKSLIGTARAIEGSSGEKAFKDSIKKILNISYKDAGQLKEALGTIGDELYRKNPSLIAALKAANKTLGESAAIGQALKDTWDTTAKSWDNIITSLSITDPLGKLGQDALMSSLQLTKAFNDPQQSIAELISLTKDFTKLRMLDPNTAKDLIQFGFEAEKVQKNIGDLTEKLNTQREAAAKAAEKVKEITKPLPKDLAVGISVPGGMPMPKNVGISVDSKAVLAANTQAEAANKAVANTEKQIKLEQEKLNNSDLLIRAQSDMFKFAANAISISIAQGAAKASIDLQKALLTGATGLASINLNADLQKKDIDLQVKALGGQVALIAATEKLALVTEEATISREREAANTEPDLAKRAQLQSALTDRSKQLTLNVVAQGQPLSKLMNQAQGKGGEDPGIQKAASLALQGALQRQAVTDKQDLLVLQKISIEINRQAQAQAEKTRLKQAEIDVDIKMNSLAQSQLDDLLKYTLFATEQDVAEKSRLESAQLYNQEKRTEVELQGKINAALEAQAFAKKQKGVTPEILKSRQEEVTNAQDTLLKQKQKYGVDVVVQQLKVEQDLFTARKTQREFEQQQLKRQTDLAFTKREIDNSIAENALSAVSAMKAALPSRIAQQETLNKVLSEQLRIERYVFDLQNNTSKIIEENNDKLTAIAKKEGVNSPRFIKLFNETQAIADNATAIEKAEKTKSTAFIGTIKAVGKYTEALEKLNDIEQLNAAKRESAAQGISGLEALGQIAPETAAKKRYQLAEEARQAALQISTKGASDTIAADLAKPGSIDATSLANAKEKLLLETNTSNQKKLQNDMTLQLVNSQTELNRLLADQAYISETASKFTENMTTAFGDLGNAIGTATEALAKMATDTIKYETERVNLTEKRKMAEGDPTTQAKIDEDIARNEAKSTADQLANTTKLIGSTKKFFDQKSMGYKILGNIEKASALLTAATQAKELAMAASTALAKIGINIPAIYASFMAQLGPWGTAAAATAMAAVGINAFNGGSTKTDFVDMTGKTSEERQKSQGTGGVFGDSEAKTKTITDSLELLAKNSIEGLNYDNELLKAMRKVADSITGAAKSIYANSGIRTGQGFGTAESSKSTENFGLGGLSTIVGAGLGYAIAGPLGAGIGSMLGGTINNVLGGIFGGGGSSSSKITSAGLELKGTFKQVMDDTEGSIKQFKDVLTTTHKDGGWFGQDEDSSSLAHQTQTLGSKASQAIADIFGSANEMFIALGKKTGVSAAQIQNTLENFDISMPIDLMNKTGQELVDELNAVIGEKISGAAEKIFTGFEKYRNFGEDYLATVLRVVDANDKVNQSLLSMGHAFSVIGNFNITESLIAAAGGLEAFQTQALFFHDNFLTAAEKLAPVQKGVNDQLTKLNISTSITRDQYKQLLISQNLSTSAGRDMYQSLMELAPGFDMVTKALDDLATKSLDLEAKIYELIGQKSAAIAIARNKELAAMDASLRPRQIYINALTDEIAIRDRLKTAYDASNKSVNAAIVSLNNYKTALLAGAASALTPAQKYADATAIFKATAQAAAATITTSSTAADIATRDEAVAKLSSVSDSFLANSKEMNAGTAQYATDLALVTTAVTDATTAMGTQLSDAKLQLGFLDTIAAATQTTADILTEYLTAQGVTNIAQTTSVASGSVASTFQIPGHAEGGLAQGISIVGEKGPELVDFKNPGRVYSNQASNDIFSTKELVEEIKALRKEVANLRADQQEQTGHLITSTYDANMKNAEAITIGNQEALNNQNWSTRSKVKVA
jgi:hypothetical protein